MTLGRNILWNVGAFVWLSLLIVFVTPYMVRRLGLEAFGLWAVVTAFTGYLTAMDFGLGNALIRFLAVEHERGNRRALESYLRSAVTMLAAMGIAASAALFLISDLTIREWVRVSPEFTQVAAASFRLASLAIFLGLVSGAFSAVPAALHRFDLLALRTVLFFSLQYSMIIWVLRAGGGLHQVVVVYVIVTGLTLVYLVVVSRKLLPGVDLRPGWNGSAGRDLLRFGRLKFPAQLSVTFLQQFDRVALGALVPVAMVGFYAVPLRMAQRLGQVAENVAGPFYPAVTTHLVAERIEDLGRQYRQGTRMVMAAVCGAVAVLGGLADPILAIWMGRDFADHGVWPFRLLLLAYGMSALSTLPAVAADAAGRPGIPAFFLVSGALLHIVVIWWAVPQWGITAAALGVLVGFSLPFFFGVPVIHRRIAALPALPTLLGDVRGALIAGAVTLLVSWSFSRTVLREAGWPALLGSVAASAGLYFVLLLAFRGILMDDLRRVTRTLLPEGRGFPR